MKAIFLDRDGVINEEVDFLHKIEDLRFIPGVAQALAQLSKALPPDQYKIIIVSNQPVIGRGICTQEQFDSFIKKYFDQLEEESEGAIRIDDFLYCPHHPTKGIGEYKIDCECRKPKPGLLLEAQRKYDIDLKNSFMIGDKRSDILAGQSAGCFSVLVQTGYGGQGGTGDEATPDKVCNDLQNAVAFILDKVET